MAMETIENEIQSALKSGTAILGYRRSIKFLKTEKARAVVVADNIPKGMDAEIRHSAKISGTKLEVFGGGSKDLGTACGKPFPVSVLVVKD